ncbi:MAG: hypothetical protein U0R26_11380 [Solirubrobacterales bacterium]
MTGAGLAQQVKDAGRKLVAGGKGKPEDAEMCRARHVIRACGDWESVV